MKYKLYLSYFGTSLGHWVALFFIPILVLDLTKSAFLVSITYALDTVPYILFTPFAGVLGDKYRKKTLIVFGELICFLTAFGLLLLPYEAVYVYWLLLLGFLISTFSAIHHPIFQSILPELFDGATLIKVNGDIASIGSMTGIVAPAILGIAFGFLGNKQIALFVVMCYLLSVMAFITIKDNFVPTNKPWSLLSDLKEGLVYLKDKKELMSFSVLFFFVNFGLKMVFVSLVWIYTIKYHLDKIYIAYAFVFIGILSIIGAKLTPRYIMPNYSYRDIVYKTSLMIGVVLLSLLLVDSVLYLTLIWGIVSMLSMVIVVAYFSYRQLYVPKELLGRVVSLTRLLSYLAIPPAALLSGYILNITNNDGWLYGISGGLLIVSSVVLYAKTNNQAIN